MKQIIEEVLQAEEKVAAELKTAREEAAEIRRVAEKEIAEQAAATRCQAQKLLQDAAEKAKQEAQALKAQRLSEAETAKADLLARHGRDVEALVDCICDRVLNSAGTKDSA